MLVNFPVVDLSGTALKFTRERKICRDVICSREVKAKKCRRKHDACAKLFFCL